jgi:3-hydroxybutyryl-CoA dehydrogenase
MSGEKPLIGIAGSGAMGSGIAQTAAAAGHRVVLYDVNKQALERSKQNLESSLEKLEAKYKITAEQKTAILTRIKFTDRLTDLTSSSFFIEAVVENVEVKKSLFREVEGVTSDNCILATNTSSLSITMLAAACKNASRFVGVHFFNPATIMPLVEVIPGISTSAAVITSARNMVESWGKVVVTAKDTPGFIVNRVARPYYSEALRILDEGMATAATIDWAMKEFGHFRMGPFELMDMIGHDVNYVVTETVWTQLYYDPRFRPSLTQKRLVEAGHLGKKSGRGFFDYSVELPQPLKDEALGQKIFKRILCMLINEAADTLNLHIASREDIDLAMTKGVNYPKGLLHWADETGIHNVVAELKALMEWYDEDRYRISPLLKRYARDNKRFY